MSMPRAGFELTIIMFESAKTFRVSDSKVSVVGLNIILSLF
jgi:hypothetical protein